MTLISILWDWLIAAMRQKPRRVNPPSESATFFAKPANTLLYFFSRDDSMPQICSICVEFYGAMCHPDVNSRANQSDSAVDRHCSTIFIQPLVMLIYQLINRSVYKMQCEDVVVYLCSTVLLKDLQVEF